VSVVSCQLSVSVSVASVGCRLDLQAMFAHRLCIAERYGRHRSGFCLRSAFCAEATRGLASRLGRPISDIATPISDGFRGRGRLGNDCEQEQGVDENQIFAFSLLRFSSNRTIVLGLQSSSYSSSCSYSISVVACRGENLREWDRRPLLSQRTNQCAAAAAGSVGPGRRVGLLKRNTSGIQRRQTITSSRNWST
jgi:hypothetical protein